MEPLSEQAPAKVNLTLRIPGKRTDGYHEIESLVMFADYGDTLTFKPADVFSLTVDGPFAAALGGENLIEKAATTYSRLTGRALGGAFHLTKRLPVAAGIGGGSADAAAAFRLLQRHYRDPESLTSLLPAAQTIGADVPACLGSRVCLMTGIGEKLYPLARTEPVPAILVNPMQPLPTAQVFRALNSEPLPDDFVEAQPPHLASLDEILAYATAHPNDLELPARGILPIIDDVLAMLSGMPNALIARLSGSGPTCFALFREMAEAESAAAAIAKKRPGWWVQAVRLS